MGLSQFDQSWRELGVALRMFKGIDVRIGALDGVFGDCRHLEVWELGVLESCSYAVQLERKYNAPRLSALEVRSTS